MGFRALLAIVLCLFTFVRGNVLSLELESRELGLTDIPACGLKCIFVAIPSSGCSLGDIDCVCHNAELAGTLAACMLANCTMADTQGALKVQRDLCHLPDDSKKMQVILVTSIVYALAVVLVAMRVAGKLISQRLGWDDGIVIVALLLGIVPVAGVLTMCRLGFGEHVWNLEEGRLLPILRDFYISQVTYVVVLGLIKVSLVMFYLEIFNTQHFRISAYIVLGYITTSTVVIMMLTIFSCSPVEAFWNRDIKGKCLDVQALAYANSASAIIQDVILLILPLVSIWKLQMKRNKKIAVGVMFGIGAFGCIATVVRLHTLLQFKISIDPTWDYAPATIWTVLELAAGFACVSLPSIRILLVRLFPKRLKELLSHITQSSRDRSKRDRSNPTPDLKQFSNPRQWKKPSSWIDISNDPHDSCHNPQNKETFFDTLLSRHSSTPSTHRHMRQGSRRLNSAMEEYTDSAVAVTHPPYHDAWRKPKPEHVEMLVVPKPPKSARHSLKSHASRDSQLTALPPIGKIGLLPEGSFSDTDVRRHFGVGRKVSKGDNNDWV